MNELLSRLSNELLQLSQSVKELSAYMSQKDKIIESEEPESENEQPVTLDMVRTALKELSENGLKDEVRELVYSYGAHRLSEISPSLYMDVIEKARVIAGGR